MGLCTSTGDCIDDGGPAGVAGNERGGRVFSLGLGGDVIDCAGRDGAGGRGKRRRRADAGVVGGTGEDDEDVDAPRAYPHWPSCS